MRLGQLARKYDVSIEKIIAYLNETGSFQEELTPNSKLDEKTTELVVEHFDIILEKPPVENKEVLEEIEAIPNEPIDEIPAEPIEEIENRVPTPTPIVEEEILLPESEYEEMVLEDKQAVDPEPVIEAVELKEEPVEDKQSINTDQLMELLETEDSEVDLSDITLIKAAKKELTGLTVLGKIELAKPKTKTTKVSEDEEQVEEDVPKPERKAKDDRQKLTMEEREAKRLEFKKRRENYEAKQANREKEKELKKLKSLKKARYEQKVKRSKPVPVPLKSKKTEQLNIPIKEQDSIEILDQRPQPKTIFGKFWRWLDASS